MVRCKRESQSPPPFPSKMTSARLTILPFPRDLEGSQVFSPGEISQLCCAHEAARAESDTRKNNIWICRIAHALTERVKHGPYKKELLDLVQKEPDARKLEVEVFRYTTLQPKRYGEISVEDAYAMQNDWHETSVQNGLYHLSGETGPLSYSRLRLVQILNANTGCLDLASWFCDGDGTHFRFAQRTLCDLTVDGNTGGYYVLTRAIYLCFYPRGIPLSMKVGILRAKQRWDLKTLCDSDAETVAVADN